MSQRKNGKLSHKLLIIIISILIVVDIVNIAMSVLIKAEEDQGPAFLREVEETDKYSYITLEFMSESFAELVEDSSVNLYIAIDEVGDPYVIAVDSIDLDKLQPIINYSYSDLDVPAPEKVRLTGYSQVMDGEIKKFAIDAFNEFVGEEILNESNFLSYMGNYYLEVTYDIGISYGYISGSVAVLLLLIVILIYIIKKSQAYKRDRQGSTENTSYIDNDNNSNPTGYSDYEYSNAKATTNDEASTEEDEVLLGKLSVEYRAGGSIFVKKGRLFITNKRLLFQQFLRKGVQASIEYENISFVKKILIFGVWIYLKDGEKVSLRLTFRNKFINVLKKYVTVD